MQVANEYGNSHDSILSDPAVAEPSHPFILSIEIKIASKEIEDNGYGDENTEQQKVSAFMHKLPQVFACPAEIKPDVIDVYGIYKGDEHIKRGQEKNTRTPLIFKSANTVAWFQFVLHAL